MGLVSNLEFPRINTKSPKFSYTKSGVGLLKVGFLGCLVRMGGPS
jgi:hypothetical protein